jgi:hypothetical protein
MSATIQNVFGTLPQPEFTDVSKESTAWMGFEYNNNVMDMAHLSVPDPMGSQVEKQIHQGETRERPCQTMPQEKAGPESIIARLSGLSTRLCSLYNGVLDLANSTGAMEQNGSTTRNKGPFGDDSAFQTLTGWLVRASSDMSVPARPPRPSGTASAADEGCDLLHDVFTASHDMLDALQSLNNECPRSKSPTIPLNAPKNLDHLSDSMVRHMVMACHMMLLNIYLAVTMSLQHALDNKQPPENDASLQADALSEVRTVVVVQLCTFLTDRQAQAVQTYLTGQASALSRRGTELSSVSLLSPSDQAATKDLERDVSERLVRLRESIHL